MKLKLNLNLSEIDSPLGTLMLVTDQQEQLRALDFIDHQPHLHRNLRTHYGECELTETVAPAAIAAGLQRYFEGDFAALGEIATATSGSELQRRVWAGLREIPAGQTTSYGEFARTLGYDDPRVAIEIGAANGANPIAIVVPCHRVIGKNGDLKGYAWGLHRKRWLLEHERALLPVEPASVSEEARLPGF